MNLTEIKKSLELMFEREHMQGSIRNIVFWYDDDGVFADSIDTLDIENVKIVHLNENNMFAVKMHIEETDVENNLLIYSPQPQPDSRENWLTDTIKYSQIFSADETTNVMLNLKVDAALRGVVDNYKTFFRNAEREKKFISYALSPYSETRFDIGVLSVLCKLPAPNLDNAVRVLLTEMIRGEKTIYNSISNYNNIDAFWALASKYYGYNFEERSLEKLAILLLVSHLSHGIDDKIPNQWQSFVSDNPNCYVFTDNFMKDSKSWADYNTVANYVADKVNLVEQIDKWTIDEIADCDTFEDFDKSIINRIVANISQNAGEFGHYRKILNGRKNRRYYSQYEAQYETLIHACEYLELSVICKDLPGTTALSLFNEYLKNLYKLDSSYRHFILSFDRIDDNGELSNLFDMVENSYTNWFLNELSMKWCSLWDKDEKWQLPGITSQQDFYDEYAKDYVNDKERVIVVVSDGLRFESAVELNSILNREQKGSSEIDAMLGVVPSYTALGMASLLPHKQIDLVDNKDKVEYVIQGISTAGTENKGKILRLVKNESIAISYDDVMELSKQKKLPDKFSGMKLIYIYHNTIDARGDNAATENEVFDATDKAFKELSALVRKLRNEVSAINIIITSDHGYLYRRTQLTERDKTPKEDMVGIISKRRFILAKENIDKQGTQNFSMGYLSKQSNGFFAILPRITNCYKIQGSGTRYVHGGNSLQEVVIPVITFKSDKNLADSKAAKKVSLGLTNLSRKITSVITHFTFFQNEPVDEKHLPLRVNAYFTDETGNRISNENIIIADSSSAKPEERTFKEKFTLKDMAYDKSKTYYLIIKDEEETVNSEINKIPFVIDLVFGGSIQF